MLKKVKKFVKNKGYKLGFIWRLYYFLNKLKLKVNSERYLRSIGKKKFGKFFSLTEPKSFNEKINWLKLYWDNSEAKICSDKYAILNYLKINKLDYLKNEIFKIYDKVEDINFDELPLSFVLKCTHGSHMNIICNNKDKLNIKKTKKNLKLWMKINYAYNGGEWLYKDIKPRIICEKYIETNKNGETYDYRVFCFNGEPKAIHVDYSVSNEIFNRQIFDLNWNIQNYSYARLNLENNITPKPKEFNEILNISKILSSNFPFVRVDFMISNSRLYLSELTFYPSGGYGKFIPEIYDEKYGDWLQLPKKGKKNRF